MAPYFITLAAVVILLGCATSCDYLYNDNLTFGNIEHSRMAKLFFVFASLVLICVSGLRYYVGTDYGAYYLNGASYAASFFDAIKSFDEPGIRFLYLIISKVTTDKAIPIFVFALITIGLDLRVIYRNTDRLFLAVLLFVFLGCWHDSFNAVRQCLAASIVMCGLPYLQEKKFVKYALVVFVAFLFHRTAIIMIAPYFVLHNKISIKNVLIMAFGTVVVLYSYEWLISFSEFVLQSNFEGDGAYFTNSVNVLRILVAAAPAVYFLILYAQKEKNEAETFYINICIVHAVVMIMASKSAMLARVGIFTAPIEAIAIPELNKVLPRYSQRIVNLVILILYGAYFFYEISNSGYLNNFTFIWQT